MISQITYEALLESRLAKLNPSKSVSAFQQIISYFADLSELHFCAIHILNARMAAKFLSALFCLQTMVLVFGILYQSEFVQVAECSLYLYCLLESAQNYGIS